jgi:quercetin dioxygenase-like cupin family protein
MLVVRSHDAPAVDWREGVATRMLAARASGAERLCLMEQRCRPGRGAPRHVHPDAEEVIVVLAGEAEFEVEGEREILRAGDSVVLPAGARHGFTNIGVSELRTVAAFSSAAPLADYAGAATFEIGGLGGRRRDAHRAYVRKDERGEGAGG